MQLNEVQSRFKDLMLDHPDALDNPPGDLADVFETGDIALSERLKVYRNNIVGSLTDVMLASFPAIEALVGNAFLERMARSFILAHPPRHGCLSFYGEGFAEFIEAFEPAKSLAYLPDIARLEIAMNASYYGRDDNALPADTLSKIAPEALADVVLNLRHSIQLLESRYPIHDIRDLAMGIEKDVDIEGGGVCLMIRRPLLDTEIIILEQDEFAMLHALDDGNPLGSAVENVLAAFPDFNFQAFLEKHLFLETFRGFNPNR